ncbi:MAG: alanine racemase [Lachnospiraceae bacterium]|nr:alanine racemase [Lachnospiraceae bacterium]
MDELLEKYYRVYAEINLDCIRDNILAMKQNVGEDTAMAAVLKTDGYGHGAVPIALALKDMVQAFAVATIDEGINLRKHGLDNEIFILGFLPEGRIEDAITYEIYPAVFEYSMAEKISRKAVQIGKQAKIQIKVDTGMGRIGFPVSEESVETVARISKLPNLVIDGIFTHFASSDSADKTMANGQYEKFIWFTESLKKRGVTIRVRHCDNSAGIIDLPQDSMDMVRAGIALYGLYPSEEVDKEKVKLRPALSMKSHIIYLKDVEPGYGISYGSTFVTSRKTKVATIPVGYGDGYQRNLSNKGYVLIRGQKAKIIGRVCMDQFMVDVTDIDGVCEGDDVTLIGEDGKLQITVEELAELAGTFNYEFVCDLGKRVPRVFYSNGRIICGKDYFDDNYDVK